MKIGYFHKDLIQMAIGHRDLPLLQIWMQEILQRFLFILQMAMEIQIYMGIHDGEDIILGRDMYNKIGEIK